MKRRDLLKLGLLTAMAGAGGAAFLRIYKRSTGVRKIVEYPAPVLRQVAQPVEVVDDSIFSLSRQMLATLRYESLVGFFSKAFLSHGLAAPQLGISKRMIVCGIYGEIKVLINPEIVQSGGTYAGYENCLSLPDHDRKIVNRPEFIRVIYRGLDNRQTSLAVARGYASLVAHEIDHLNGILYIDHQKKPDKAEFKDDMPT